MRKTSISKQGIVTTTLLNEPITKTCTDSLSLGSIVVSKNKTYYVEFIRKALGNGEPTSSKCSAINYCMYKGDWSWSRSVGIVGSSLAYSQIGKIVRIQGSFTISTANDGDTAYQQMYWLVGGGYANGTDNQTHELYYYKVWDSDGVIIAMYGTDRCALDINNWIEV